MDEKSPLRQIAKAALFALALLVAVFFCCTLCGCEDPEGWGSCDWPWDHHTSSPTATVSPEESPAVTTAPPTPAAESAAAGRLVFRFGGFDGSRAAEDPATQIGSLHISRSKLSYRWTAGSLRNWGLADSQADGALACAFYWSPSDGAWIGGKFDWISTSRTTRDWNNLNGGYHGWNADAFWAAPKRAFCIISKDGRRRTNLLATTEP